MSPSVSLADLAEPADPLAAAAHPNPYPYYARLVAERPLHRDERLGAWVAASAEAVAAVLASPACRVRPPAEPVPAALAGSPVGDVFGRLVRMNDGEAHARLKPAVTQALAGVDLTRLAKAADARADALLASLDPVTGPADVTAFAFALPVQAVAALAGFPQDRLGDLPALVNAYVVAAGPFADAGDLAAGAVAARELLALAADALDRQARAGEGLLLGLAGERPLVLANAVGLLVQAYEATAGVIGATLLALGGHPDALAAVRAQPQLARAAVEETLRWDPFVQNMRRWLAADAVVAGASMRAGEAVVALPAAAGRDPALNPDPHRFDLFRQDRRSFAFGAGVHACPAHSLAPVIAAVGVRRLLQAGVEPTALERGRSFRRSPFRVPVFG